ncbi:HPr kinase/phosphorylase [Oenococcus sicerae]|uniref:HPr(Ser) kinase/phosphatase n=1 Tax=Oenococcus sicerae TaxID=2203724 RepID=UPI0010B3B1B7|nr:HPr kinase/phosphorylase [Oenococcus sicerae]
MDGQRKVTVKDLVENTALRVVWGEDHLDRPIKVPDIARPGLQLTGFLNYFEADRVQLYGVNEIEYAKTMTHEQKQFVLKKMSRSTTPAFVISTNLDIPAELIEAAKETNIPVLTSSLTSSRLLSNMTYYLGAQLSERKTVHGVLIDINGIGVLLTGDPGVGKTEAALELIQQGKARLIADDRVDIYAEDEQRLVGAPSEVLANLMEVRGIGIIDVLQTYGAASIRDHTTIVLNIDLKRSNEKVQNFDRLGDAGASLKILGIEIPKMALPVTSGRNTASVIDAAALKYRTDRMGFDALATLEKRQTALIKENEIHDQTNK